MVGVRVRASRVLEHVAIRLRAEERQEREREREEMERERKRVCQGESAPCIERWRWRRTRV